MYFDVSYTRRSAPRANPQTQPPELQILLAPSARARPLLIRAFRFVLFRRPLQKICGYLLKVWIPSERIWWGLLDLSHICWREYTSPHVGAALTEIYINAGVPDVERFRRMRGTTQQRTPEWTLHLKDPQRRPELLDTHRNPA